MRRWSGLLAAALCVQASAAPVTLPPGQPDAADGMAWLQVEIPAGSAIKYEVDTLGRVFVDRFLPGSQVYPANYGSLPGTLAGDGDPLDALVITRQPLPPGVRIAIRPVGVLHMRDGGQADEKLIAVPATTVDADFAHVVELQQLPASVLARMEGFFAQYKASAGADNPVQLQGWGDAAQARALLRQAIEQAGQR